MLNTVQLGDQYDYIGLWLYEASDYIVEAADKSQRWDLREPTALYDYLSKQN